MAVRPEQVQLVGLLCGTVFLIVKCNGNLFLIIKCNFKNALQWNLTKAVVDSETRERVSCRSNNIFLVTKYRSSQSIFLASSGSFTVENDNIHGFFFSAVLVANFEFAGFAPKQKYTGWTLSMETVHTAKS